MQLLGGLPLHFRNVYAFLGHLIKWRKLAQLGDHLSHFVNHVVDLFLRVEAAEPKADRGMRQIFADAEGLQHVDGLERSRGTGRAARYRDVIDAHQQRFAFYISEAHVQVVGEAVFQRAVDVDLVELGFEAGLQTVAQGAQPDAFFRHLLLAKLAGLAQADDARHVERAGAHATLVAPAIDDGGELHARIAAANIKRTDALGTIDLVAAQGQQVDVVLLDVDRNLANGLDAVHREEDTVLLGQLADFRHRVDDANFVVGVHDGNQDGLGRNGLAHIFWIDPAVALHREISHLKTVLFQAFTRVQHRLVLDGLRDDVVALLTEHLGDALDHQVVGLGGAGGIDDFFGRGVDQRSDLLPRSFNGFFAGPPEAVVAAGGIAEFFREVRQHRFDDARIHRRGGVIVHVNRQLDSHFHRLLSRIQVRPRTGRGRQRDERRLLRVFAHLRNRDRAEHVQNAFIHATERLAHRTSFRCVTVSMAGHTRGDEHRAIYRRDHLQRANLSRLLGQLIPPAGTVLSYNHSLPRQALQHLRGKSGGNAVLLSNFTGAAGMLIAMHCQVLDGDQPVVGLF